MEASSLLREVATAGGSPKSTPPAGIAMSRFAKPTVCFDSTPHERSGANCSPYLNELAGGKRFARSED